MPVSHGAFAFAAALELLQRLDPCLAQEIHNQQKEKPLTVSPLFGSFLKEKNGFCLFPGQLFSWRLTGLRREVAEKLVILSPSIGEVRIGHALFKIAQVATHSSQNCLAGQETYAGLVRRWASQHHSPSVFTLRFITPTTFRQGSSEIPFPLPHLIWGSLLKRWNMFSSHLKLTEEIKELIAESVLLTNWKGETKRLELGSYRTVGFLGKFTYRLLNEQVQLSPILAMLAEFAFYAGAGWQTTHGMGQMHWLRNLPAQSIKKSP